MKVILTQDIKNIGKKDQILEVNDGYARNFLIPKKLGVQATTANLALLKSKQESKDFKKQEEKKEAKKISEKLEKIRLDIKVKSGENGKIFGGVTSKEIVEILKDKYSINIEKKKVDLKETIKTAGITIVEIKLFEGVIGKVKVNVIPEKK
jgi:ribosomal protein L9